jgi:hypothetical protein
MLRSVSCTLAGGVTCSVVAAGREKLGALGARAPEATGCCGVGAAPATGGGVWMGAAGVALRGTSGGALVRTGVVKGCIDGERFGLGLDPLAASGMARLASNVLGTLVVAPAPAAGAAATPLRTGAALRTALPGSRSHPAGATGSVAAVRAPACLPGVPTRVAPALSAGAP